MEGIWGTDQIQMGINNVMRPIAIVPKSQSTASAFVDDT